jgi:septal ring factor EnvC (AmiA/AmiB activator)
MAHRLTLPALAAVLLVPLVAGCGVSKNDYEELSNQLMKVERERDRALVQLDEAQAQVARLEGIREENEALRARVAELDRQRQQTDAELATARESIAELRTKVTELEQACAMMDQHIAEQQAAFEVLMQKVRGLQVPTIEPAPTVSETAPAETEPAPPPEDAETDEPAIEIEVPEEPF